MSDVRKDLLIRIKKARLAGYKPKKDEQGLCVDLHKQEFIGRERVLASGKGDDEVDSVFYRYYMKPKGHRYVGVYESAVPDILYRGGSCPVGMDRHGRTCMHEDGVFLSASKNVATYYATRFSEESPLVEECMLGVHSMMMMDGKGWTSPELRLNQARSRYIHNYDAIKVVGMHMGHLDDHDNRYMTNAHKEHEVPELCDIYIVFNSWDVYPLSQHSDVKTKGEDMTVSNTELLSITVPNIG